MSGTSDKTVTPVNGADDSNSYVRAAQAVVDATTGDNPISDANAATLIDGLNSGDGGIDDQTAE